MSGLLVGREISDGIPMHERIFLQTPLLSQARFLAGVATTLPVEVALAAQGTVHKRRHALGGGGASPMRYKQHG